MFNRPPPSCSARRTLQAPTQLPTLGPAPPGRLSRSNHMLAPLLLGLVLLYACSPHSVVEEEAPAAPPLDQEPEAQDAHHRPDKEEASPSDLSEEPSGPRDTWLPISTAGAPEARTKHSAVWTGSEMIVWGGQNVNYLEINTGGRYDPRTDTWKPISTVGAPHRRSEHSAVWTGEEMIVWGGASSHFEDVNVAELQGSVYFATGGRYDPRTDTWREMSTHGAPTERCRAGAVWTGSEMLVWGGTGAHGGRYDPQSDQWRPIATAGAHPYYDAYLLAWTGREMVVWSGDTWNIDERATKQFSGARYTPFGDTWRPMAEPARLRPSLFFSLWTGDEIIVAAATREGQGGSTIEAYHPESDTWRVVNPEGAPRYGKAVWTGAELIVWRGRSGEGSIYDPGKDQWRPISEENAPQDIIEDTAVWTGEEMIVWGGRIINTPGKSPYSNAGHRYRP